MVRLLVALLLASVLLFGCSGSGGQTVSLTEVRVTPASPTLAPGTTTTFRATSVYSNGNMVDDTSLATWSSSNPAVATVNANGVATAISAGTTTISATRSGVTGTTILTVAAIQSISVTPATQVGIVGTTQQFRATATLTNGATQDVTSQVTWSSSNPSLATVASTGVTSALAVGPVTVTATSGTVSGSATLNVVTVTSLAIAPLASTADLGTPVQFTATGTLSNGGTSDITTLVTWGSSDQTVATVNTVGAVTGVNAGTATITASFPGVAGASTTLTVLPPTSLTVTPANVSLVAGSTRQFTATGGFADGTTRDLTSLASWSSSAPTVATVSNVSGSRGTATALSNGTAVISASVAGVVGSTTLTVRTLSSITVTPASPTVSVGSSLQLTATGTFSDNSTQDLTNQVAWSSSLSSVAPVSNVSGTKGVVIGQAQGSAVITASFPQAAGAVSGSTTVNVQKGQTVASNEAFVTNSGTAFLSAVDLVGNSVLSNILVGGAPQGVALNTSSRLAYVANNNNGTVSVVNIDSGAVVDTVAVGSGPWGVAVNSGTNRVYVSNQSGTVSVIDGTTDTVVATIPVGTSPRNLALNAGTSRLYVANFGSNTVSVISTATNQVVGTINVGLGPVDVAVNSAASLVYVANSFGSTVSVISTATGNVVSTIPVGNNAQGIAFDPTSARLYVTLGSTNQLVVADTGSNAVVATIPVGTGPRGVAVRPSTGRVYVANFGSSSLSVVNTTTNSVVSTVTGVTGAAQVAVMP
ncbi:hypothetical protein GMSM_03770 [Geomonas sp. Red276]